MYRPYQGESRGCAAWEPDGALQRPGGAPRPAPRCRRRPARRTLERRGRAAWARGGGLWQKGARGSRGAGPCQSSRGGAGAPQDRAVQAPQMWVLPRVIHRWTRTDFPVWDSVDGVWITMWTVPLKALNRRRKISNWRPGSACRTSNGDATRQGDHQVIHHLSPEGEVVNPVGWNRPISLDAPNALLRPRVRPSPPGWRRRGAPRAAPAPPPRR